MASSFGTVRCISCDQDLTDKIQVYDNGKVYCEVCNWRVGKGLEVPSKRFVKYG